MGKTHTRLFTIQNYEVGPYQAAHVRTLLDYLQETADSHIKLLGASVQDLMKKGLLWVLSAYYLEVERYPGAGEDVSIRTWYPGRHGRFYLRDFEVLDGRGQIAAATTSWALIGTEDLRPVSGEADLPDLPVVERRSIQWDFPTLPGAGSTGRGEPFTVPASCLDMYRHVNHVFYIQWALDSVVPGTEAGILPASVEATFRASALSGERLTVSTVEREDRVCFDHSITREGDGREITRLRTRWRVGVQE